MGVTSEQQRMVVPGCRPAQRFIVKCYGERWFVQIVWSAVLLSPALSHQPPSIRSALCMHHHLYSHFCLDTDRQDKKNYVRV